MRNWINRAILQIPITCLEPILRQICLGFASCATQSSWLQWILPRETIVVDSQSMELRRTQTSKELNRLLANPNPLDGINAAADFNLSVRPNWCGCPRWLRRRAILNSIPRPI